MGICHLSKGREVDSQLPDNFGGILAISLASPTQYIDAHQYRRSSIYAYPSHFSHLSLCYVKSQEAYIR